MNGFFDRAENLLLPLIDQIYACMPRPSPGVERLKDCRIISHRGEHDGRRIFENTLAAFDAAVGNTLAAESKGRNEESSRSSE